jgi:hypothetical protein
METNLLPRHTLHDGGLGEQNIGKIGDEGPESCAEKIEDLEPECSTAGKIGEEDPDESEVSGLTARVFLFFFFELLRKSLSRPPGLISGNSSGGLSGNSKLV